MNRAADEAFPKRFRSIDTRFGDQIFRRDAYEIVWEKLDDWYHDPENRPGSSYEDWPSYYEGEYEELRKEIVDRLRFQKTRGRMMRIEMAKTMIPSLTYNG